MTPHLTTDVTYPNPKPQHYPDYISKSNTQTGLQSSVSSIHTAGGGGNFPPEILNPRKFLLVWIFERRSGTSCDLAVFFLWAFVKKMLPLGAIFELKIHKNAYAARASPRTPLESLQSSQTP